MQDVLYPALARHFGKATETPGRARPAARRRLADRRGVRRPVADRQDGALQPGELCRRLRRDPQALRRGAAGARAQLQRRHVQLQRRRRALPDLRRLGLRACGDAVPQRRLPALPGLRRPPLPRRDPGREDRSRGPRQLSVADVLELTVSEAVQLFRDDREVRRAAAADRRCRPGLREAGPAGAHAVGRRGAAAEAGRLPGRGGQRRRASRRRKQGPAVPVRRADHRPALRRHRQADARAAQAARRRPFADRHRAQPRRDPRGRLDRRPRPRRRRGRRRGGVLRHARRREGACRARTPARRCATTNAALGLGELARRGRPAAAVRW